MIPRPEAAVFDAIIDPFSRRIRSRRSAAS